ncbi:MAG: hypothetical protein IPJ65_01865 [Archangiaceae bacterium]|nr:hypothetical protein [Archangiaceae bacterium]
MKKPRPRWQRVLRAMLVAAGVLELLYVIAGNLLLAGDRIPRFVEASTPMVKLHWDQARTWWPGQTSVEGFSMQLDTESDVQMDLRVEQATTTLKLWPLLHRRLSFDHTRAHGVVFRMVTKLTQAQWDAQPARVAAFPRIEGLPFPPVRPEHPSGPPPTPAEIDGLFGIEMLDVVTDTRELWFDEYRYVGTSHVKGAFGLQPLKALWVGPAWLTLDGGKLSAADTVVLPAFTAGVDFEIGRVSLLDAEPSVIASTLTVALRSVTRIEDVSLVKLYLDGVEVSGGGLLSLDVKVVEGKVMPGSTVDVTLDPLAGKAHGFAFAGRLAVEGRVTPQLQLKAGVDLVGQLTTPVLDQRPLVVSLESVNGEVLTERNDLSAGLGLQRASARVNDARAADARPVTEAAGNYVPGIAQALLGDGPLSSTMTVTHTPAYTVLRLKGSKLGQASLAGAMLYDLKGWNGAAAGLVGALPIGLVVTAGKLSYRPSTNTDWLSPELERFGISPESTAAVAP